MGDFHANIPLDESGRSMLCFACRSGSFRACKILMQKGANANHRDSFGNTPLHFAFHYKHFDIASWLIGKYHADDTATNINGLSVYSGLAGAYGNTRRFSCNMYRTNVGNY